MAIKDRENEDLINCIIYVLMVPIIQQLYRKQQIYAAETVSKL